MTAGPLALVDRLLDHGIPVVVCHSCPDYGKGGDEVRTCRKHKDLEPGKTPELHWPWDWQNIDADEAREKLDAIRPGLEEYFRRGKRPPVVFAMVTGHGIDVVDVDPKNDGSLENLGVEFHRIGRHRTPSGGIHDFVVGTGLGKKKLGGVGDFCGGDVVGSSRALVYLPGSSRPKYPDGEYVVEEPIDFDDIALDLGVADAGLVARLEELGCDRFGENGKAQVSVKKLAKYNDDLRAKGTGGKCNYGKAALRSILAEAETVRKGDRHNWGIRWACRAVQLANAGCFSAANLDSLASAYELLNPDESFNELMRWAVSNPSTGPVRCRSHGEVEPDDVFEPLPEVDRFPEPSGEAPSVALERCEKTFRKWLGDEVGYDIDPMRLAIAAMAIERLDGDPLWVLVVTAAANTKTETIMPLAAAGAYPLSTVTGDAAFLSATPIKERAKGATGGVLRKIGSRGTLILKDLTSILSLGGEAQASVFAALREMYDGVWVRAHGADGGQELVWEGRLAVVAAVTTAWDTHQEANAKMGARFVVIRPDSSEEEQRKRTGQQALNNLGSEVEMREELAEAACGVLAAMDPSLAVLTELDHTRLLAAANVATRARTAVERNYRGEPLSAHAPEAAARFVKQLGQVVRGTMAIGVPHDEAVTLAVRCARDSIPTMRLAIIDYLATVAVSDRALVGDVWSTTAEVVRALGLPRTSVSNELQALVLLGVLEVVYEDDGGDYPISPSYRFAAALDPQALDLAAPELG